jgi:gamma-glutamylcyclotransferase (GGCT)/AIG2-like uncharacterized protein YtfP
MTVATGPEHLFVYGSLMSRIDRGMGGPQRLALQQNAQRVGEGSVCGLLYDLGRYPGLVLATRDDSKVFGEVWRLLDASTLLRLLDRYEGISVDRPETSAYERRAAEVLLDDGRSVQCWLYVYLRQVDPGRLIPGGRWSA